MSDQTTTYVSLDFSLTFNRVIFVCSFRSRLIFGLNFITVTTVVK